MDRRRDHAEFITAAQILFIVLGAVLLLYTLKQTGAFDADDVVVVPLPDRGDRYRHLERWNGILSRQK